MLSKEEIQSSFKIIETICDEEICLFNKTIVQGNVNQIKRYIDQLKSDKQKLIEKLEKDIVNITKTMKYGNHYDDYRRCRLKAYRTKTKEILEIVKGVKNENIYNEKETN